MDRQLNNDTNVTWCVYYAKVLIYSSNGIRLVDTMFILSRLLAMLLRTQS
jgi:hypothetical protein